MPDGCWLWFGGCSGDGQGAVRLDDGRVVAAHRAAWFLARGAWPPGDLWRCRRNLACVRPEHASTTMPRDLVDARTRAWLRTWVGKRTKTARLQLIRARARR